MLIEVRIHVNIFLILLNFSTSLGITKINKINRIFAFDAFAREGIGKEIVSVSLIKWHKKTYPDTIQATFLRCLQGGWMGVMGARRGRE